MVVGFLPAAGSSPRAWGTGSSRGRARRRSPVHPHVGVGNSWRRRPEGLPCPVHPHACGERSFAGIFYKGRGGSSPRVWGTETDQRAFFYSLRFIPTRVGNGDYARIGGRGEPVHPHACGERFAERICSFRVPGSSPRVWGTVDVPARLVTAGRFIPTRVGNGIRFLFVRRARAVHPHACGERKRAVFSYPLYIGSSPRVWGTAEG